MIKLDWRKEETYWLLVLVLLAITEIIGHYFFKPIEDYIKEGLPLFILFVLVMIVRVIIIKVDELKNHVATPSKPVVDILLSRRDVFKSHIDEIDKFPIGTQVLVTHFEKISVPYGKGTSDEEEKFMQKWFRRVSQGDFSVRQIVHIGDLRELQEVKDRIEKFKQNSGYSINILTGEYKTPFIDLFVVKDRLAYIDLSADPNTPRTMEVSFLVKDSTIVNYLENYFNIWWNLSIPVKKIDGVDEKALQNIQTELENERLDELVANYNYLKSNIDEPLFIQTADQAIQTCKTTLRHIVKGQIILQKYDISALIQMNKMPTAEIKCTSYVDNIIFWPSEEGKKLLHSNEEAIRRGARITRIFILTNQDMADSNIINIVKQHQLIGVSILLVKAEALPPFLKEDLQIQNRLLFKYEFTREGEVKGNLISIDEDELKEAEKVFSSLMKLARKPEEFFDQF